jgi:hypothetical protein
MHSTIWYGMIRTADDTVQAYIWRTPHSHTIHGSYYISSGSTVPYDTIQHDTNHERYITIHTANPAQYDMTRYDSTWYEPRVLGLQNNTYMYGKPHTVHTICCSYCISSGSTVRYDTIRTARMPVANRDILFSSTNLDTFEIMILLGHWHPNNKFKHLWNHVSFKPLASKQQI